MHQVNGGVKVFLPCILWQFSRSKNDSVEFMTNIYEEYAYVSNNNKNNMRISR